MKKHPASQLFAAIFFFPFIKDTVTATAHVEQ
jgi:hypothetical protein